MTNSLGSESLRTIALTSLINMTLLSSLSKEKLTFLFEAKNTRSGKNEISILIGTPTIDFLNFS